MNKHLFAAIPLVLLGCATGQKYDANVRSWLGSTEQELVEGWGAPAGVYQLPEGGKLITFLEDKGSESETTYDRYTRSLSTETERSFCKVTYYMDAKGIAVNYRKEGNACRSH